MLYFKRMTCPYCAKEGNQRVIESRARPNYIYRRRECLTCKRRFSTREVVSDLTQAKMLKEGRRSATKVYRLLRDDHAVLWESQAMTIDLCRRILRALGADDSLSTELASLLRTHI